MQKSQQGDDAHHQSLTVAIRAFLLLFPMINDNLNGIQA
jgi:hypothetical protein